MNTFARPRLALLYPGDRAMRDRADPAESRFAPLFAAFADAGVETQAAVWHNRFADEVRQQLLHVDGVLVWCNPIEDGQRRDHLDALLSELSHAGVFVSTLPDVIARLGTKDVLFDTRDLPFGSDVFRINSLAQLRDELPRRLAMGPRVLKQHRGHSGIGIWRVEQAAEPGLYRVRHAQRGSVETQMDLAGLQTTLAPYFEPAAGGHMIDQAWQRRLGEGMVRAYLVEDRVTGFGHQLVNALHPEQPQAGQRVYFGPELEQFQSLRQRLESHWVQLLCERMQITPAQLPMLWDCDFMFGEPTVADPEPYVLCEINVSSVSPFPPSSIGPLVAATRSRLLAQQRRQFKKT